MNKTILINEFAKDSSRFFSRWMRIYFEANLEGEDSYLWFRIRDHKSFDKICEEELTDKDVDDLISFLQEYKAQKSTKKGHNSRFRKDGKSIIK